MSENRLARETSPYLLQHKQNPVHWHAWGPEALAEAKATGKPILLSVGYAACHWCHVMAHESFEDPETAAVMNDLFVNIKVDREERPDVDAIYMAALHRLGEQGGWPLTMFLDADARPFWGGTYFPKRGQWGRPAFTDVLRQVARIYREDPDKVANNASALTSALAEIASVEAKVRITDALLKSLVTRMVSVVDPIRGGISGAPKFPQWSFFWLLWKGAIRFAEPAAAQAVETTLVNICQGGIFDHLRGGFARYSVDERWLVPHFEKMLYDNALLIDLLTEVWRETANPLFKARVAETVGWLEAEMIAEGGGFAASLDADSEGEEGKFYVWTAEEIRAVLGEENADRFSKVYDVTKAGNWEGHTILNRLGSLAPLDDAEEERLAEARAKLLERRASRPRPGWDDKVLADWNGLMIAALARAGQVFRKPGWIDLAARAFDFVSGQMVREDRLAHSYRQRLGTAPASAGDYANMIWGALRLFEATADSRYLDSARRWTDVLDRHYWHAEAGGYTMPADDTADILVRMRSAHDDATPNANAVMVSNHSGLFVLTGEQRYADRAEAILAAFSGELARNLVGHAGLLAASMDLAAPRLIVLAGSDAPGASGLWAALHSLSLPGAFEVGVSAHETEAGVAALTGKIPVGGRAAAYACIGPQCSAPVRQPMELVNLLRMQRLAEHAD